jgi:hypothetical protein
MMNLSVCVAEAVTFIFHFDSDEVILVLFQESCGNLIGCFRCLILDGLY